MAEQPRKVIRLRKNWSFELKAEQNGERLLIIYGPPERELTERREKATIQ